MANIYNDIYELYKDKINIICIYILEAHFVENDLDGWPIGTLYRYPQHKSIDDRINMANIFIKRYNFQVPLYIDNESDDFNNLFHIWPDKCIFCKKNEENNTIILLNLELQKASRNIIDWKNEIINYIKENT